MSFPTFDLATLTREIDKDGIGWAPARARERHMGLPVVVFLRGDGWSLGASAGCEAIAFDSWRGTWTHYARSGEGWRVRPIAEYHAPRVVPAPGFPRRERVCEACGAALGTMTDMAYVAMGRSCDACADQQGGDA